PRQQVLSHQEGTHRQRRQQREHPEETADEAGNNTAVRVVPAVLLGACVSLSPPGRGSPRRLSQGRVSTHDSEPPAEATVSVLWFMRPSCRWRTRSAYGVTRESCETTNTQAPGCWRRRAAVR